MLSWRRPSFWLYTICSLVLAIEASEPLLQQATAQQPLGRIQDDQKPFLEKTKSTTLPEIVNALDVLQAEYFTIWQGIWPTSIDWTGAVIGTYLSAALSTLSTSFPSLSGSPKQDENLVNKYFSQLVAYSFGQDAFALRQEAYDDMLWVVLGWLESIKFITTHTEAHYGNGEYGPAGYWYGEQWTPAFAHRARLFWEMASAGWDTTLCNGGMIWSPYLTPYKNAITNELYIAASISMYLYFPGDNNMEPYGFPPTTLADGFAPPRDAKYLAAAIEGYRWLSNSNMTDSQGLYVDGFHISGWSSAKNSTATRCDDRNEMVYTYNQGVLLSGQRGLYEATGARSYLEDGHQLVADVIAATGWDLNDDKSIDAPSPEKLGNWYGLGRSGILEEVCDSEGYCSQDSQTFKGIFFHHLTLFCADLPDHLIAPGGMLLFEDYPGGPPEVKRWHGKQCARYGAWVKHNAKAALATLNSDGKFGMWWGAPVNTTSTPELEIVLPADAVDYRNQGVPKQWEGHRRHRAHSSNNKQKSEENDGKIEIKDLNDRGRGRTVETQGGGIAVLRALWEIVDTR